MPLTVIILSGQRPENVPAAAGLSNFVRIFCGAVGTSTAATVWNDRTIFHHARLAEQASIGNPRYSEALDGIGALTGHAESARNVFEAGLNAQAVMLGINDVYWASAIVFIAIIPLIWFARSSKGAGGGGAH